MQNPFSFRAIIEPDTPKGFHAFVPLLPGLHTQGATLAEVKKNLREAILCHLQALHKDNQCIPQEEDALEVVQSFSASELART